MKKIILLITALLCCALLLASCGGESCSHENSRGGVCLDCGEQWGFFKEYKVTFKTPDSTTTETFYAGENVIWPQIEIPDGYDFGGWVVYSDDGGEFFVSMGDDDKFPVERLPFSDDGETTLTAVLEKQLWSINYVTPYGGSGFNGNNPTRYKFGETIEITTASNRNEYDVQGWYFDEALTQPATVISGMSGNITLYGKVYYMPFGTVTEVGENEVALSDLRPSYGPWVEGGENTFILPETYRGKTIVSAVLNAGNLTHLIIESKTATVSGLPEGLKSIEVCEDHKTYKSVGGDLYSKDGTVLYRLCLPYNTMFAEIPEGVTTIGSEAISNSRLKSLTLPSTLTAIEQNFDSMSIQLFEIYNLSENITLSKGSYDYGRIARYAYAIHTDKNADSIFTEIDEFVFLNTDDAKTLMGYVGSDTAITLPASCNGALYDICAYALYRNNITELTVSPAVTKIDTYAFPSSLTKITFEGSGVEFIGVPFMSWYKDIDREVHVNSLTQWLSFAFESPSTNPLSYGAALYADGVLVTDVTISDGASLKENAFYGCSHLNSVTIGAGIGTVPRYAFGKTSIVTLTLSDDITEINSYAFEDCSNLTAVKLPSGLQHFSGSSFDGCDALIEITSDGAKYIGTWLVGTTKDVGDTLIIREGTVGIADNAVSYKNDIKTITVPASVKYIGFRAISEGGVEVINYNAIDAITMSETFYQAGINGNGITVNVGANVKSIPANLFGGDLASGLVYGTYAPKVKSVVFLGNAVKSIGESAFANAIYLESITLPDSLESIGKSAFYGCRALKSINIPENVKTIAQSAFRLCNSLESVNYYAKDASLESSSSSALFGGAGSSVDTCVLTVGSEVTAIPAYIFYNTYFTSVIFEERATLTSVGDYAFYNNDRLVSIDLPDSVDTLGQYAFSYCDSLTAINGAGLANVHEKAVYESRNMPDDWGYEVYGNINYYFKTAIEPVTNKITWARFKPGSIIPDGFFQHCMNLQHVYIPEGCTVGNEMFKINSFSSIDKRLTLRVFFEGNDYEGTSAWRNIITHDGTEYKLGMVVSVNGENATLGTFKYNVPISKDGFAYILDTKTTPPVATILGYFNTSESLTIGGTVDGYTIFDIDDYAFYMHNGIGMVVISAEIGDMAFAASSITNATLDGVNDIGTGAFMSCISLTEANLGDVEEIGAYAFNGCTTLWNVDINSSTEHNFFIRDYAFAGCTSLSEITLPANIYTIGTGAFSQSGLTRVYSAQVSEWYIISDAASTNPDIIFTYTVTTPEALATALVTTYADYYWANKALMQ